MSRSLPVFEMSFRLWDAIERKFGWLAIPFVYGDVTDDAVCINNGADFHREYRRSKSVYTGVVASTNFFFLMTCSLFAVCMTPVMESNMKKNVILEDVFSHVILIVIMIAGSIVKLLLVIFRDKVAVIHGPRLFKGVDRIVYLIGLVTFYLSGCISDLYQVIAKVTCDQVWRSCGPAIYDAYVTDVIFYLTKMVYLGGSILFALVFYRSKFLNACLVKYGLVFLLSTYLAIWFDMVVYQSRHFLGTEQATALLRNLTTYCSSNYSSTGSEASFNTTLRWQCITHTTPTYKMLEEYVGRVCYPIAFQVYILIIEGFWRCFPVTHNKVSNVVTSTLEEMNGDESAHTMSQTTRVSEGISMNCLGCDSNDESRSGNKSAMPEETTIQGNDVRVTGRFLPVLWAVILLATILINVPGILFKLSIGNCLITTLPSITDKIWKIDIVFNSVTICAVSTGYAVASSFRILRSKPFTVLEYLIVTSMLGRIGRFLLLFLIHFYDNRYQNLSTEIYCSHAVVYIFQCYYELPFYFLAVRVVAQRTDGSSPWRAVLFKTVLIYLAVCNVMLWFVFLTGSICFNDAFDVAMQNNTNAWRYVDIFLQPFSFFYRFGCFLLTARALRMAFSNTPTARITKPSDVVDMPK